MPESPADETAVQLDALHSHLVDFSAEVMTPGETGAVGNINVTVPGWLVRRAWNELRTAARQLRSLAGLNRGLADRVGELESTTGAQQVELSHLRGSTSEQVESLSRFLLERAAELGWDVDSLPAEVAAQRDHDAALWGRLDRERGQLEAYRLEVLAVAEQIRTIEPHGPGGLDVGEVSRVLLALDKAYRKSRS